MKYDHAALENKWQKIWDSLADSRADIDPHAPKYYVLDMFPYPSNAGLHVGHLSGYTASDVIARYKRQKGFAVLHPMGWDSFGLPAEQHALRTEQHPAVTTAINTANYRRQLKALGLSYDWEREICTTDPKYYKWTQWIFTKLYEKGLAYQAEVMVNFCPTLGTVLANEEVEGGHAKEGGYPVEQKPLRQWMLRITAYAERLLADLELLEWPLQLKKLQEHWIGKRTGLRISFPLERGGELEIFTTRPETIFGVTFLAVSTNHPLEQSFALHPLTKDRLPILRAEYAIDGAIMGVPAHDERDKAFALQHSLPEKVVIDDENRLIASSTENINLNGLKIEEARKKISQWLIKQGYGEEKVRYRLRDWLFSRQRYWGEPIPILHLADGSQRALELDELPLTLPHVDDFRPTGSGHTPLGKATDWHTLIDLRNGQKATRELNTMPQWAGSCWYYLRFCDPTNDKRAWSQESERYWMPVDLYIGGVEHAVSHLLYARFWHKVLYDCGLVSQPEPFTRLYNQGLVLAHSYKLPSGKYIAPTEAVQKDGKWLEKSSGEELIVQLEKMSKSKLNGINPDQLLKKYGADALRLYVLFMGPLEKEKVWQTDGVKGCYRFLERIWRALQSKPRRGTDDALLRKAEELVVDVEEDIERLSPNTAIAKMMTFVNILVPLPMVPQEVFELLIGVLYPFAPHIAAECWELLGNPIGKIPFPQRERKTTQKVLYLIQVDGRLRATIDLESHIEKEELIAIARERVSAHLKREVSRVVFVPGKLINFVLGGKTAGV